MPSANHNVANESCGWASRLPVLQATSVDEIVSALDAFVRGAPPEQFRAWKQSVPPLQEQCRRIIRHTGGAGEYGAVMEYPMPDSFRRADAILLIAGNVLVIELKGDGTTDPAYIEQVADYARRLYWYHSECGEQKVRVRTIVVSYGLPARETSSRWHTLTDIENLHEVVRRYDLPNLAPIPVERFVAPQVCQPAPSLVQAVRRFFADHALPRIKRIDDITGAALQRVVTEIRQTHQQATTDLNLAERCSWGGEDIRGPANRSRSIPR